MKHIAAIILTVLLLAPSATIAGNEPEPVNCQHVVNNDKWLKDFPKDKLEAFKRAVKGYQKAQAKHQQKEAKKVTEEAAEGTTYTPKQFQGSSKAIPYFGKYRLETKAYCEQKLACREKKKCVVGPSRTCNLELSPKDLAARKRSAKRCAKAREKVHDLFTDVQTMLEKEKHRSTGAKKNQVVCTAKCTCGASGNRTGSKHTCDDNSTYEYSATDRKLRKLQYTVAANLSEHRYESRAKGQCNQIKGSSICQASVCKWVNVSYTCRDAKDAGAETSEMKQLADQLLQYLRQHNENHEKEIDQNNQLADECDQCLKQ